MKCSSLVLVFLFSGFANLTGATTAMGDEPVFRSSSGTQTTSLDCRVPSIEFPPIELAFFTEGFSTQDGSENSIRCTTRVEDRGKGRKRVKVTLTGEIVSLDDTDDTVVSLPTRSGRTDANGELEISWPLDDLPDDDLAVLIQGAYRGRKMEWGRTECTFRNRMPCQDGPETLCLLGDERFKVEVALGNGDPGRVSFSGTDTGSFYFFSPSSEDVIVQLLNRCGDNGHFWVFYSALTNVNFDLTVTDTETGDRQTYNNRLGRPAPAITDTNAFATCP